MVTAVKMKLWSGVTWLWCGEKRAGVGWGRVVVKGNTLLRMD